MAKAKFVGFRKPDLVFYDQCVSWSGKYWVCYGIHYKAGKPCYDVCASNGQTGEVIRRHYNEDNNLAPEASAKTYWLELKEKMLAKPSMPEEPTQLESFQQWLDIHIPEWRKNPL